MQALLLVPAEGACREQFSLEQIHHREIPGEDAHAKFIVFPDELLQDLTQTARVIGVLVVADQFEAAVDIPADYQDLTLRLAEAVSYRAEIVLAVHTPAEAPGVTDLPAVAALAKQSCVNCHGTVVHSRDRYRNSRHERPGYSLKNMILGPSSPSRASACRWLICATLISLSRRPAQDSRTTTCAQVLVASGHARLR